MERALRAVPYEASVTYRDGDSIVDPGTVTIGIVRADGTQLVAPGTATYGGAAAGPRTFDLTAAEHTATLDRLTLTWTSATLGTLTTHIEVVGGFLFSVAQARARDLKADTFPTDALLLVRAAVERALEDACGVAFVPRAARATLSGPGERTILPEHRRIRRLVDATVDGAALTAGELADVEVLDTDELYRPAGWPRGVHNITVAYEHGHDEPPGLVDQAALELLESVLLGEKGTISPRATGITSEAGSIALVTAGVRGALFGVPSCNAVVDAYGYRTRFG